MTRSGRLVVSLVSSLLLLHPSGASAAAGTFAVAAEIAREIWEAHPWPEQYEKKVLDLPLRDEGDRKIVELPAEFHVGDCFLSRGASVAFYRNGTVRFHARGGTNFTISGDVWHQFFTVKDRNGRVVYQNREQFRVPEKGNLTLIGKADEVDESQNYDATTFDQMSTVRWDARC